MGDKPPDVSGRKIFWLMAFTLLLTFLAYARVIHFGFVSDDRVQIVGDPYIRSWSYVSRYFIRDIWDLSQNVKWGNYYRPFFLLWLFANYHFFKLDPVGWHLTTLLLHLGVTLLVFFLARKMTRDAIAAVIAALIFGLHPAHIESVAWISGVTEALAAAWVVGAFLCYLKWRDSGGRIWAAASLTAYVLGMLSQETALVLPLLIFAYEWFWPETWMPERGPGSGTDYLRAALAFVKRELLVLGPYAVLTALYLVVRWRVIGTLGYIMTPVSFSTMVFTWPSMLWFYARHLAAPFRLNLYYHTPYVLHPGFRQFYLPLLALVAIAAGLFAWWRWAARNRPAEARLVGFSSFWIFCSILPVLDFTVFNPGEVVHDRYLYLPSVGLAMLAALGLRHLKWGSAAAFGEPVVQIAAVLSIACAFAVTVSRQDRFWATDVSLYVHALNAVPKYDPAVIELALALREKGHPQEAVELFQSVLSRHPGNRLVTYDLGYTYYWMGNLPQAERYFRRAILIDPTHADEFFYLGLIFFRQDHLHRAEAAVRQAIRVRHNGLAYHLALGMILMKEDNPSEAVHEFKTELSYHPGETAAHGQLIAAEAELEKSRAKKSDHADQSQARKNP